MDMPLSNLDIERELRGVEGFRGVFSYDSLRSLGHGEFCVVNTDNISPIYDIVEGGHHWLTVCRENNDVLVFDSVGDGDLLYSTSSFYGPLLTFEPVIQLFFPYSLPLFSFSLFAFSLTSASVSLPVSYMSYRFVLVFLQYLTVLHGVLFTRVS